jgi:hypothetical protein
MLFEKLKSSPRQKPISHSKRKRTGHKLAKKKETACIVERRCAGCHEKVRQEQSREATVIAAKKIKTFF